MNILNQEILLEIFHRYNLFFVMALFAGGFLLTWYLIPKVLWVSREKNLVASVNSRSSHARETPSFGGVAFYITFILLLSVLQGLRLTYAGNTLIAAVTILFMVGLKDDLVVSTARVKLVGQFAAAGFIIFSPELQLTNLHGFLGIYEIPEIAGYFINTFLVVAVVNAYNLIDGIDGLAALVGIVISGVLAYIFHSAGQAYYMMVSMGLAGILCGFLRYNFSRGHKKIFMGDSGSLLVGLVIAFLAIKLLVMKPVGQMIGLGYDPANRLLFLGCVLFIPVFDTLRVMLIRLGHGKSPFSPDKNHAHHVLLDLGFTHWKASLSLALLNLLVIGLFFYFANKLTHLWLALLVVLVYAAGFLLFAQLKVMGKKEAKETQLKAKPARRES